MENEVKTPLLVIEGKEITLSSGGHHSRGSGVCAMEAVAWMAGEPHSDRPQCVSPLIADFLRSWNDSLPDESRTELIAPLLPMTIGTRTTPEAEEARAWAVLDWMIRVSLPAWLDLTESLRPHAELLRSLVEVTALTIDVVGPILSAADSAADSAARSAADSAARSAADSAADSAARSAADSAAYSAARSAARSAADSAARSAAYSAARSAARSAADSAAYSAARSALSPVVKVLQASACGLIKLLCSIK